MSQGKIGSFLEAANRVGAPVLLGLTVDFSRMKMALETPDDIGAIVRLHKDLDRELKRLVRSMVQSSARQKHRYLSDRIECLKAAGLPESRLAASRTINSIRNAFAHDDKERFEAGDVERLLEALQLVLGRDYTQTEFHDCTTDPYGQWDYQSMDPKGKFCLLAFLAIALVGSF